MNSPDRMKLKKPTQQAAHKQTVSNLDASGDHTRWRRSSIAGVIGNRFGRTDDGNDRWLPRRT